MSTAMVWGAAGGIGGAVVERLAGDGWMVVGVARDPRRVPAAARHVVEADVADAFSVQRAVLEAGQVAEPIDLWLYAIGDIASARTADMAPADWDRLLAANLTGAFLATHYSLPYLRDDAHLVYVGALSERLRVPGLGAYAAAKTGLEAFATALAKEQRGRRVTLVRPGAVDTPLWDKVPLRLPAGALAPAALAERILAAHGAGEQGLLDV
jgi:NAD(P)-dependent dehydrogenase (short-subunit alcohol dehydrogenase family)